MAKVFISYRRSDSAAGYAMSLAQQLRDEIGEARVFRDVRSIPLGADFAAFIRRNLASCVVMLVVIGHRWASETDEQGRLRLDQPEDWVRQEVATALKQDILVVPVLVGGATLPEADELPTDLQPLLARHAVCLSDRNWQREATELIQALGEVPGVRSPLDRLRIMLARFSTSSAGILRPQLILGGVAMVLASLGALAAAIEDIVVPGVFYGQHEPITVIDTGWVEHAQDLTGTWVDSLGVTYAVTQTGPEVLFSQLDEFGVGYAGGIGYLEGSRLQLSYGMNGAVISQWAVIVGADGLSMSGTLTDPFGLVTPLHLRRV